MKFKPYLWMSLGCLLFSVSTFGDVGEEGTTIEVPAEGVVFSVPDGSVRTLNDLGLIEGGFVGGENPLQSDRIWKVGPEGVKETYWYRLSDQSWRSTKAGFASADNVQFSPGDQLFIKPRVSKGGWSFTIK